MKNFKFRWFLLLVVMAVVCQGAFGQAPDGTNGANGTDGTNVLAALLGSLGGALTVKYGWLVALVSWMGVLRGVFKPITTAIENYVRNSPSTEDDKLLAEVEASAGWKFFCWALDFLASVKFGTQFTAKASGGSSADGATGSVDPTVRSGPPKGGTTYGGIALGLILFCGLVGQACAVLDKPASWVSRPQVQVVTNTVTEIRTNFVAVPVQVPGQTTIVTNIVEKILTNTVERVSTVTNWVEKAGVAEGLQAAKTGSAIATTVAPQFGVPASAAVGILGAAVASLVAWKNKREAQAANATADEVAAQNAVLDGQLRATVAGVEQFATSVDPNAGAKVKDAISKASRALGVADDLHETVKAITS